MITFNQCRISWDGKYLYLTVQIDDLDYFTNVYIDNVKIDTSDNFVDSGPSSSPIYTYTATGNQKSVSLALDYRELLAGGLLKEKMFFVWVTAKGTPAADTPCGLDSALKLCVAFNESYIFSRGLALIKELSDHCTLPANFVDWSLLISAFKLALDSGKYSEAIKFWKIITHQGKFNTSTPNCGCHG